MRKNKNIKETIKENKGTIITGITIGTAILVGGYTIYSKNCTIHALQNECVKLNNDIDLLEHKCMLFDRRHKQTEQSIDLLRDVMSRDVIGTVKESLKRRLRYHEGRINNAIRNDNVMTEEDMRLHLEEIEIITKQICKLENAEKRLTTRD